MSVISFQKVQDEQGYVIFGFPKPVPAGHVAKRVLEADTEAKTQQDCALIECPVVAIAPASLDEWRTQCRKYGHPWDEALARRYHPMKCVAE